MSLVANPESSSPLGNSDRAGDDDRSARQPPTRVLLLAAIPAIVIGLLIRAWVVRSSLLPLNADDATTGLQSLEVLEGRFHTVVAGNQYGSTTESYLFAPLVAFWSGTWPLRVGAALLSILVAYALIRLARPILGRTVALVVGLVGWTMSGAIVIMWSHAYMGYTTGFVAQVAALALACQAMRTTDRLARIAFYGGLAAGIALWSHPMFGVMSLLALIAPTVLRWRSLRSWWLPVAAGGVIGVSPWLVFIVRNGLPSGPTLESTYAERIEKFFVELMPRLFGVRAPNGQWLDPSWLCATFVVVFVGGALSGLVFLVVRRGAETVPILVSGFLAFPALALFPALSTHNDGRYGVAFIAPLLMGLAAWSLLLPRRVSDSPWLVAVIPTVWALALCVPVIHHQIGWTTENPDSGAEQVVDTLRDRGVHYLAGEYWGVYRIDYLADRSIDVKPDFVVRFPDEAARVDAADPGQIAYIYTSGLTPTLLRPVDQYDLAQVGGYDLYLPKSG